VRHVSNRDAYIAGAGLVDAFLTLEDAALRAAQEPRELLGTMPDMLSHRQPSALPSRLPILSRCGCIPPYGRAHPASAPPAALATRV
jgi:hypothetical protein